MIELKTLKIGPKSHGRPISEWEFDAANFTQGYKYEIIDGRIEVAAEPEPQEFGLEDWLEGQLKTYAKSMPDIMDKVARKARVYIPGRRRTTIPEPDIACYADFPHDRLFEDLSWHEISPILLIEVLVYGNPEKDLKRNVELYLRIPTVQEYWVLDGRIHAAKPSLIQHRRLGSRWVVRTYRTGTTFTTKMMPGFELVLDPFA